MALVSIRGAVAGSGMMLAYICCCSFSPSAGGSASQVGSLRRQCSVSAAPGEPGKQLVKGLAVVGIALEKQEEKQLPWKETRGNKNSQELSSLSLFPGCFLGLSVCCLGFLFLKKKHQNPMRILLS